MLGLAPGSGFQVQSLRDLDTYLGAVSDAGFAAVSLGVAMTCGDPDAAAKLVQKHGLVCTDVLALVIRRDDKTTMAAVEAMRPAVQALQPRGVLSMVWTRIREESLDRIGRAAERLGVPLLLEFAPGGIPTAADAEAAVRAVGPEHALLLADAFHVFRAGTTLDMFDRIPPEHLALVQFDDAVAAMSDDYMVEANDRRAWPGEGEFPLSDFVAALRRQQWDGAVSVEVLSEELRKLPIHEFACRAYESTAPFWR